ncbi:MAG: rod shape-determining protein MreC, partial [Thermodesulfobacteriota bacterium]
MLDSLAANTGLEFVSWVLRPGKWVADKSTRVWDDYFHLVDVQQENRRLAEQVDRLSLELAALREDSAEAVRLRKLLSYSPPRAWTVQGARVIAHRLGPAGALDTVLIDKGSLDDVKVNAPVGTPGGVAGRVLRAAMQASTVLLVSDPNSKIPVVSRERRTTGILSGQGAGEELEVRYVPLNAPLDVGEVLVTSGLAGIFPKGLPVAEVTGIERSDISLFLTVRARPLVDFNSLEEVLLFTRVPGAEPEEEPEDLPLSPPADNATQAQAPADPAGPEAHAAANATARA